MGNSPKKVLFLITKGNFGGAQRYVFDLATSLPKNQFIPIVAFGQSALLKKKLEEKDVETLEIASLQRNINPILEFRALKEVYDTIKKVNPDILHVNSSKAGVIGTLAGRLCGVKKIIFTAHNWAWNENRNFVSKIFIFFGHWLTALLCHNIICVSEETARQGRNMPFVKHKIVVIHNGIGHIELLDRETARKNIDPQGKNTKIIGFIGELHENKGVDVAMKAFDLIHDKTARLFIIGTGEKKEEFINFKNTLASKDRIIFVGFKEVAQLLMNAFDIFLLPSRNEALPYVLLEAGMASVPVVATSVGGVPEIIVDDVTGILVPKENPKLMAEALSELLNGLQKSTSLGNALKDRISNLFSLTRMVQNTIDLYNERA